MHAFMAVRNLRAYVRYRQSLGPKCPHCHQETGNVAAGADFALPDPPIQSGRGPAQPRESPSANSAGQAEGDVLLVKT